MGNLAIKVDNLSKIYRIGGKQERYITLRDTLTNIVTTPFRKANALLKGHAYGASNLNEEFLALKNLSFEVNHGEVVGIIGRNGAGKSTLLKILSRITEPSRGYADVYGRVGALLEVGTGFHPELTGRENIYLNGTILGMKRQEIQRKFDEIVDFAGVEKFLDTPVKHYSSGLGLRLGFSVAAHLEPEILVIDEVLAVGDVEFQKKCLGKMSSVSSEGRTVLFVSHNMGAVRSLCSRALILESGELLYSGDIAPALQRYQEHVTSVRTVATEETKKVVFSDIRINDSLDRSIDSTQPFTISFDLHLRDHVAGYSLFFILNDADNQMAVHSRLENHQLNLPTNPDTYHVTVDYPPLWLRPGIYSFQLKLIANTLGKNARYVSDMEALDIFGNADPPALLGYMTPNVAWKVTKQAHLELSN